MKRVESYSRVITHVDTLCAYYALRNASFITSATFLVARLNRMSLTVLNPISYRGLRNRLVSFRACEIANVDKRSEFRNWRLRRFIQQRLNNEIILLVILYRYLVYISTFLYKNAMIKIFNYAVIRCQVAGGGGWENYLLFIEKIWNLFTLEMEVKASISCIIIE